MRAFSPSLFSCFGSIVLISFVAGCSVKGGACRTSDDCIGELECAGPNEPYACGMGPRQECASDASCFNGEVCQAIPDLCSAQGTGSMCRPRCAGAADCTMGFRCGTAGACEPLPCDEGWRCPSHQRCDMATAHATGPVWGRSHGCVDIACSADSDCPSGKSCTNQRCQDGPGKCVEVMLVP